VLNVSGKRVEKYATTYDGSGKEKFHRLYHW
jgi:hypothetical protein